MWCIFELAAKVRTHGVSAIDVMPTAACTAIGTPCIMCLGGSLGLWVAGLGGSLGLLDGGAAPFPPVLELANIRFASCVPF